MKNFLALAAALVVVFAGVGWYLDWYRFTSRPNGEGKHTVTVDFNTDKISSDLQKAREKLQKLGEDKKGTQAVDGNKTQNVAQTNTSATQQPQTTQPKQQSDGFWIIPPEDEKKLFGPGTQSTSTNIPPLPAIPQAPQPQTRPEFRSPTPVPPQGTNPQTPQNPDAWQFPETQPAPTPQKQQRRNFFFLPRRNNN